MLTFIVLEEHFDYFFTNVNTLEGIIKLISSKCYKLKMCAKFHQITLFCYCIYFFKIKT